MTGTERLFRVWTFGSRISGARSVMATSHENAVAQVFAYGEEFDVFVLEEGQPIEAAREIVGQMEWIISDVTFPGTGETAARQNEEMRTP